MIWLALAGVVLLGTVVWFFLRPATAVGPASRTGPNKAPSKPASAAKNSAKSGPKAHATEPADAPAGNEARADKGTKATTSKAEEAPGKATPEAATSRPATSNDPASEASPRPRLPRLRASSNEPEEDSTALTQIAPMALAAPNGKSLIKVHSEGADVDEPTGLHSLILVTAVAQTDKGRRRRRNEDSYQVLDQHSVFLVADGMGGHLAGEVASQLAAQVVSESFADSRFAGSADPKLPRRADELLRSIRAANDAIYERSRSDSDLRGMGTTVVAARFSPTKRRAYIAHVGDSRCYRIREGQIEQLTEDHTLSAATGASGSLGDRLTRALGVEREVQIDLQLDAPSPGDLYLLCSDGLSKMVPDEMIRDIALSEPELQNVAQKLIDAANERGGNDNITAVVIRVDQLVL